MAFEDRFNRARFPVNLGVPVTFNLNPGLNMLRGNIIVAGTATIAGGTTNGTAITEGGPVNLVKRIKVIANKAAGSRYRGGALVNCSAQSLLRYAITQRQGKYFAELSGSTLGNGAVGVYPIYLSIPIYFGDTFNLNGVQTALNMNPVDSTGAPIYSAVQVQIDFAAALSEIFYGSDRTLTFAGTVQWDDVRLGLSSDTIPLVQEDHYSLIQAANEEFVDQAMPNDGFFNQWLILAQQGGPTWQLSDALLNRMEIRGASLNFRQWYEDLRQSMFDEGFYDPNQNAIGQFLIDWTHGVLANSNAAAGLQHLISINNPSGAGLDRLRIYTRRFFPLAPAA